MTQLLLEACFNRDCATDAASVVIARTQPTIPARLADMRFRMNVGFRK